MLLPGVGILSIGILAALATNLAVAQLTPVKLAFVFAGFALLISSMAVKDRKTYWLFLLVFSIPFDISKLLSAWLVDPNILVSTYGQPASGTAGVEFYLTDVVVMAMLVPWLAQICLRQQRLYFPKIGYCFVLYLLWALLVSLINAQSYYLTVFDLFRQTLYFVFFVYLINNLTTRSQFRSVAWAVFFGFVIGAGTVIIFFELGIGTESSIFTGLHDVKVTTSKGQAYKPGGKVTDNDNLTLHDMKPRFGLASRDEETQIKRSHGMFRHPAIAANMCGLVLPVVLAYLVAARTARERILLSMVFVLGIAALVLTFSRAGAIGFAAAIAVFFAIGSRSGWISRRVLILGLAALTVVVAVSVPFLLIYFGARPGSFSMRFYLFEATLQGYSQHPFFGVGLNNGTAAMKAGRQALTEIGIPMPRTEATDSFYLVLLTEVGPLGFFLFFLFFGKIVLIALHAIDKVAGELKPLLIGIVAGLASLAVQNLADDTLAGHAVSATLWLFAGLIIAIARSAPDNTRPFPDGWVRRPF